jgi:hypothetical protein
MSEPVVATNAVEACTDAADFEWAAGSGKTWGMTATCGPAWLDEACCFGSQ